jgi:DNA-binding NarL/FixJ family response regulator
MRLPQLVVCETDDWIAELLRGTAGTWQWVLRQLTGAEACLRALRQSGPGVAVIEVGRHLEHDLLLVERLARLCPETPIVVVTTMTNPELTALAWDLGASYVHAREQPRDALLKVVASLMETAGVGGPGAESASHE